jgi:hypothetical protein
MIHVGSNGDLTERPFAQLSKVPQQAFNHENTVADDQTADAD